MVASSSGTDVVVSLRRPKFSEIIEDVGRSSFGLRPHTAKSRFFEAYRASARALARVIKPLVVYIFVTHEYVSCLEADSSNITSSDRGWEDLKPRHALATEWLSEKNTRSKPRNEGPKRSKQDKLGPFPSCNGSSVTMNPIRASDLIPRISKHAIAPNWARGCRKNLALRCYCSDALSELASTNPCR